MKLLVVVASILLLANRLSSAQVPTGISLVSPLPYPSFPTPGYWQPFELTQDGWVLMVKTSDPVVGRRVELWKPFVGTIPIYSATAGYSVAIVDSAIDDPQCRPGHIFVCGSLYQDSNPNAWLGFVYEIDTASGAIHSIVEGGLRILRFQPSDRTFFRINGDNPSGMPPWNNELVGVPSPPLPQEWYLLAGASSRYGWGCLARNYITGDRAIWAFARVTGAWTEVPIPNCDEVIDLSDDGLLVVREFLSPGYVAYHSMAADGSVRHYPGVTDPFEAANSHGLALQRSQVYEHSTGMASAFPGPLNLLDFNDRGAVVGTEGYYQMSPATSLIPADCSAPVLSCPLQVFSIDAKANALGEIVHFAVTAIDDTDPSPSVICAPPSGSYFLRGTTIVTCTSTDYSGNQSVCVFPVVVLPTARQR